LEHSHVKAIFGRKKTVQLNRSPYKMAGFRKFKDLNIEYSHRDPQKTLPCPERRHLTYFAKNSFRGIGCSLIEEPKKTIENQSPQRHGKITYLGRRNPLQNFACRVPSRT